MDEHADVEQAVRRRYTAGARAPENALCCPTSYDPALLEAIPQEVLARDYGCGDPTRHLRPGETVLDLARVVVRRASWPLRRSAPRGASSAST